MVFTLFSSQALKSRLTQGGAGLEFLSVVPKTEKIKAPGRNEEVELLIKNTHRYSVYIPTMKHMTENEINFFSEAILKNS
jgi:hypothetical protein